jgi:hypothetical protein
MVMDILERSGQGRGMDRILACAPSKHHPFFKAVGNRYGVHLWNQEGEDLGSRMSHAFHAAFQMSYQSILLIGTDIPSLQSAIIEQALKSLATYDVVLGPTMDGGYYLIGLKKPMPDLFTDIPWSTDQVLTRTQQHAHHLGLSVELLPQLRDLDTIDDLQVFIKVTQGQGKQTVSSRTAQVLKTLGKRLATRE